MTTLAWSHGRRDCGQGNMLAAVLAGFIVVLLSIAASHPREAERMGA